MNVGNAWLLLIVSNGCHPLEKMGIALALQRPKASAFSAADKIQPSEI